MAKVLEWNVDTVSVSLNLVGPSGVKKSGSLPRYSLGFMEGVLDRKVDTEFRSLKIAGTSAGW